MAVNGEYKDLLPIVISELNLSQTKVWQQGIQLQGSTDTHVYTQLADGGIIVSLVDTTTAYSYRLDSNFKLIKSVAMTNLKPHKIANPEKGAKAELAFWAMFADNI